MVQLSWMGKMGQKSTAVNTEITGHYQTVSHGPSYLLFRITPFLPVLILGWGGEHGGMYLPSQPLTLVNQFQGSLAIQ